MRDMCDNMCDMRDNMHDILTVALCRKILLWENKNLLGENAILLWENNSAALHQYGWITFIKLRKWRKNKGEKRESILRRFLVDLTNKTKQTIKLSWMVFFVCHASNFGGSFSICAIYQRQLDHGRSVVINDDQWRSARDQWSDHCGSWQADRSGAFRQSDQTWQDAWLHKRDILSSSCMCIDNTAVTFQKYIGFGVYKGLENPTQQNKKRGWSYRYPFFFFMNWYFYLCFCVICGNINTDSKKKSYQRCV